MKKSQRKNHLSIYMAIVTVCLLSIAQVAPICEDNAQNKTYSWEENGASEDNGVSNKAIRYSISTSPDLIVTYIDRSMLNNDNQALTISGSIFADIENQGTVATGIDFDITFFEDSNNNGNYESSDNILGSTTYYGNLNPGTSATVSTVISGIILFRDNLIYAFVDSENIIIEDDETNNLKNTGEDCEYRPPIGAFNPILEWAWTGSLIEPDWDQVMCTPAVADLNQDDIPDIVFNTFTGPGYYDRNGILRAISGDGSGELFSITNTDYRSAGGFNIAIADIDNDDLPEIINLRHRSSRDEYRLMAFENDGTHKWLSDVALQVSYIAGATVADIDENGEPEIIVGEYVFNNDGTLRWQGTGGTGLDISTIANLDMDGDPEIVAGNTAYYSEGNIYWQNGNISDGRPAVGNFDNDNFPEVVMVGNGYISMLEHNGTLKWGPLDVTPPGTILDSIGPPTIADFDGDGEAEIGVAGGYRYVVYEGDGSVKWSKDTQDWSSSITGSSVFDFEGDGNAEVIYADEEYLRIYNGSNGDILWNYTLGSGTLLELPVIVDVDNDNNAEIVMVANDYVPWSSVTGVYIFGDANDNWVNTRKIWNQHAYHITNVNDDATIPQNELNNWQNYNNFRCQAMAEGTFAAPDLSACFIRVDDTSFPSFTIITARIGNGGAVSVTAGVSIAFYDGDPSTGGTLLGTIPTSGMLAPGQYEDVSLNWINPVGGYHDFFVVADDDGTGQGNVGECCELNNIWDYATMIGLIPPNADAGSDQTINENDLVQFDGSASNDPDGTIEIYEWDFESDGIYDYQEISSDAPDGAFDGKTTYNYGDDGIYKVTLRITDNDDLSDTDTCNITVKNVAPTIYSVITPSGNEGTPISFSVTAIDYGSDDLTFTWNWDDGTSSTITTYYNDGVSSEQIYNPSTNEIKSPDGTFPFNVSDSIEHTWGDNGVYLVTLVVEDDDGGAAYYNISVVINNISPTVTLTMTPSGDEGELLTFEAEASDSGSDDLTFEWEFEYGPIIENVYYNNGLGPEPFYDPIMNEIKSPLGDFPLQETDIVTYTYGDNYDYYLILKVSDDDGGMATYNITVSVNNVAPSITEIIIPSNIYEGSLAEFQVSATDKGSDDLTFNWEFEGGPSITNVYYNDGANPDPSPSPWGDYPFDFSDTVQHTYGDNGNFYMVLTIIDDDGGMTTYNTMIKVDNVVPSVDITGTVIVNENSPLDLQAHGTDPGSDDLTFTWDIEFGPTMTAIYYNNGISPDLYPSPEINPMDIMDYLTHTWGDNGVFLVTLTVTDDDGGSIIAQVNITVNNVRPSVYPSESYEIDENSPIILTAICSDVGSDDLTITWDWGDGFSSSVTSTFYIDGTAPDPFPSPDVNTMSATDSQTHTYGDNGAFTVTISVEDDDGGITMSFVNVTVNNVAPSILDFEIYMYANISLRVAGEKYHSVSIHLYEDGSEIWTASVTRYPGNPEEQKATISNVRLDMTKSYNAVVDYLPNDPRENGNVWGANPVWIDLTFRDGSTRRLHHTFNVRKSYWDSDHWNHIDPWEVDMNSNLVECPFELTYHIIDPGSDDVNQTLSYGSQTVNMTHLNNPPNPDPYPSPEINPVDFIETITLIYEGPRTLFLIVEDDDGDTVSVTMDIS